MPKVEHAPASKASAAAIVRLGTWATGQLSDEADNAINRASTAFCSGRSDTRRQAAPIVLTTAQKLTVALGGGLALVQSQSANLALRRLLAELRGAGLKIDPYELPTATALLRPADEAAWAIASSESLAAQWRSSALARVTRALRQETNVGNALRSTKRALEPALKRTAVTEVTRVYADTHRETLVTLVDRNPRIARWVESEGVCRMWVALIDACDDCEALDGETADIDGSFPGGDEPPLHPHCHCHAAVVSNVSPSRKA